MSASQIIHVVTAHNATRDSLGILLKVEGYTVKKYASIPSFLAKIEQTDAASCILADAQIPGMDGLDLLAALNERGIFFPVIVMSGIADHELETTVRMQGAVNFFETPLDPEILLAAIRNALTLSHN
ncbi:response regulator [uncultured Rhodoblastus sp.]|uniref:response regulator transcription factor n=1 Tax=uncultured Rhodoblastus sp. TaxID=543037 RepID=UPI0025F40580|nr:response regulator [uncultured Rhodoblastus sp.]